MPHVPCVCLRQEADSCLSSHDSDLAASPPRSVCKVKSERLWQHLASNYYYFLSDSHCQWDAVKGTKTTSSFLLLLPAQKPHSIPGSLPGASLCAAIQKDAHTHAKPAFPSTKCLFLVVLKPALWLPTRNSFDIFPVIQVGSQQAFWEGDEKQHGTNTAPYGKKRWHLQRIHKGWEAPLAHHPAHYLSNLLFLEEFSMRNSFERPIFPSRMIQMFSFVSASSLSLVTVTIS